MKTALSGKRLLVLSVMALIALGQIVVLAGCGSGTSNKAKNLVSIAVSPSTATIATGATQQFTATGTFSDNSTQDMTSTATWSSSSTNVATVTGGLATAVSAGSTTITVTSGSVSGSASLTVTSSLKSIAITPANASIGVGSTQQFMATATFSDNTTKDITSSVSWSSSSTSIATINASGTATAVAPGTATITATSGSVSATANLTVTAALKSITVAPSSTTVVIGGTQQFTATGTYTDNTQQNITSSVTWTASPTTVATITSAGVASGVAAGTATITATSGSISGTAMLTVVGTGSSSGSTGILVVPFNGGNVDAAYQPYSFNQSVQVVNLDSTSSDSALIKSIPMPSGYEPDATAADQVTMKVAVVSYFSVDVQIIDANTNTVVNTYTSPVTHSADFSGGSCYICGVFFNPKNDLAILDTGDGYYSLDVKTGTFTALVSAFTSENFSMDSTSQLIVSPTYDQDVNHFLGEIQILDLNGNSVSTNTTLGIEEPDSAAVDLNTQVAVIVEEYTGTQTLINLNELTVADGNWTAPTQKFTIPGCGDNDLTMIAVDSGIHALFSSDEFESCTAIESLPSSPPSGPPTMPTGYVWDIMPNTPDKNAWFNGGDPHGVAIFTSVVDGKHYGFLVNDQQNWVARIDLSGALAATQMGNGHIDLTPYTFYLPTTK